MSIATQMRQHAADNKGKNFTATGLARVLGLKREKTIKVKDKEGTHTEVVSTSYKSKTALRVARKCGAKVQLGDRKSGHSITF